MKTEEYFRELRMENGETVSVLKLGHKHKEEVQVLLKDGRIRVLSAEEFDKLPCTDIRDCDHTRVVVVALTSLLESMAILEKPEYKEKILRMWKRMYRPVTLAKDSKKWCKYLKEEVSRFLAGKGYKVYVMENDVIWNWDDEDDYISYFTHYIELNKYMKVPQEMREYMNKAELVGVKMEDLERSDSFKEVMMRAVRNEGYLEIHGVGKAMYQSDISYSISKDRIEHTICSDEIYQECKESLKEIKDDIKDGMRFIKEDTRQE